MSERVTPSNVDAERAILGGIFLDQNVLPRVKALIATEDFLVDKHRKVYQSMLALDDAPIDIITIQDELNRRGWYNAVGGIDALAELNRVAPSAANVEHYCGLIAEAGLRRRMINACNEVITECYDPMGTVDEVVSSAVDAVNRVASSRVRGKSSTPLSDVVTGLAQRYEDVASGREDTERPVCSGIPVLDEYFLSGGWRPGELIVIGARTSHGKTAFCVSSMVQAAKMGHRCVYVTLEMDETQIGQRILAILSGVPLTRVRSGKFIKDDWAHTTPAVKRMDRMPINIIDVPGITAEEIISRCENLKRSGLDAVYVDYLQLIGATTGDNREQKVAHISRQMKLLARRLGVPVILMAQLNREAEKRGRPRMSDLRESGAVEQDADVVILLHWDRPDAFDSSKWQDVQGFVEKNRNGETRAFSLSIKPEIAKYSGN